MAPERSLSHGGEEYRALAGGVRRKKDGHIIIKKRQSTRAQTLGVGAEVQLAAEDARFQLHCAIAAIAEPLQNTPQVGEEEHRNTCVTGQLLFETEVRGVFAEVALLQKFERPFLAVKELRARRQALDRVHDQVHIVELPAGGIEEVRRHAARCAIE